MTDTYTWTGPKPHQRRGHEPPLVMPGEVFAPTEAELRAFPDLLEPAQDHADATGGADSPTTGSEESDEETHAGTPAEGTTDATAPVEADAGFDPSAHNVQEVRSWASSAEDASEVRAALEAEASGEARNTAIEALEQRLNALEE